MQNFSSYKAIFKLITATNKDNSQEAQTET